MAVAKTALSALHRSSATKKQKTKSSSATRRKRSNANANQQHRSHQLQHRSSSRRSKKISNILSHLKQQNEKNKKKTSVQRSSGRSHNQTTKISYLVSNKPHSRKRLDNSVMKDYSYSMWFLPMHKKSTGQAHKFVRRGSSQSSAGGSSSGSNSKIYKSSFEPGTIAREAFKRRFGKEYSGQRTWGSWLVVVNDRTKGKIHGFYGEKRPDRWLVKEVFTKSGSSDRDFTYTRLHGKARATRTRKTQSKYNK